MTKRPLKMPPDPAHALRLMQQMRSNVVQTIIRARDPQQTLVDMDRMGAGEVWRAAVPKILEEELTIAGHGKYWREGRSSYQLSQSLVAGVLSTHHDYNRFGSVEPAYPQTHLPVLANQRLDLVVGVYEAATNLGSVGSVAAVKDFLWSSDRGGSVHKRFNQLRDKREVYEHLLESDTPDLVHQAIKVEATVDKQAFEAAVPELMLKAQPAGKANLVEHYGAKIAQQQPQVWAQVAAQAEALSKTDHVLLELNTPPRKNAEGHPIVSSEVKFIRQVRDVISRQAARRPFTLEG